jgi:glutamate/tyrosine decarboxylase-like PLP-dependent enzyme
VYAEFVDCVMPFTNGNLHPRFYGWVQGNGTPLGMMADMLAHGINPHMAGFNQAPARVEARVIRWLVELMGFPAPSSGVLTAGGTMANVLGLAVARNNRAGFEVKSEGLTKGPPLRVYGSTETHGWAVKGCEFLGLGRGSYREVPVDPDFRLDLQALREVVAADRAAGMRPVCVIGTAGTVNTGATDDLEALAAFCREEDLWFHVDGAFGALARLSQPLRALVRGIEQADSLAFDLHKWMYQPFTVACLMVRDPKAHAEAFSSSAPYLAAQARGVAAGGLPFADLGLDLTREFRALKIWMALKAHGVQEVATLIEQNVMQAGLLERLIHESPDLELLAPVAMNIVCFRFSPSGKGLDNQRLDEVNQEILLQLQERGLAVPSSTLIQGRFALRCCFTNHRTRFGDVRALVGAVLELGREILGTSIDT